MNKSIKEHKKKLAELQKAHATAGEIKLMYEAKEWRLGNQLAFLAYQINRAKEEGLKEFDDELYKK